jgi:hypothetical protein
VTETFEPVRVKGGWAVRNPDGGPWLAEGKTKKAAAADLERRRAIKADLQAFEDASAAREAAWLAERGLVEIDPHELAAGDSFITSPPKFCPDVRTVVEVKEFDNGVVYARYDLTPTEMARHLPGCALFLPGLPAYGILRGKGGSDA